MTPKAVLNKKLDWVLLGCYLFLVVFGWMNIFSSSLGDAFAGFDWQSKYGMQIIWIASAAIIALFIIYVIPARFYSVFAWWMYAFMILSLLAVIVVGKEINGSKSWIALGPFQIQPAEFSKIFTALALAALMEKFSFRFANRLDALAAFAVIAVPAVLILAEKEAGLALVYVGFLLTFYREGMTPWIILSGLLAIALFILTLVTSPFAAILIFIAMIVLYISFHSRNFIVNSAIGLIAVLIVSFLPRLGRIEAIAGVFNKFSPELWLTILTVPVAIFFIIRLLYRKRSDHVRGALIAYLLGVALIFSVDFVFDHVLQDHQRLRIETLLGIKDDPMGAGYNVHQSKIAIGSGGIIGKGFLHGTQTRFDFVPEQSTDFIFCTVGEEWGFLGALVVIICYVILIMRLYNSAERQKSRFARIYGYCVASCILMHVVINIGMTIGLMPVIGIPLPFISYGGSSLWAFTILLFIFIRLDYEGRQ
ncbi:MAG: rod shape-determining protein RodA [Bacteroidales bacterium]|nr:rod shape-determining protein RodA [Bacteroidales bacterium]MBR5056497.1 rod shape-determining protein RodA [Bacteroidales bacterium]